MKVKNKAQDIYYFMFSSNQCTSLKVKKKSHYFSVLNDTLAMAILLRCLRNFNTTDRRRKKSSILNITKRMLKSYSELILPYGSELWSMNRSLEETEMWFLTEMLRISWMA